MNILFYAYQPLQYYPMQNHQINLQKRRQFLKTGITAGALLPLITNPALSIGNSLLPKQFIPVEKAAHPLKILILGGTSFLGPHQINYALNRGHSISTFTRGKTKPTIHKSLFKEVENLEGDRDYNLEALRDRTWDAVIDNSGHFERWTKDSAELLYDNVDLYLYTSSTGVYYPYLGSNLKEDTKLVLNIPEGINDVQKMEYGYGVMKAKSEIAAKKVYGDRAIIVRPTYMMGPGDGTDRFTYWPERLSRGGQIMIPGKPEDPVQYIDVRDVASYMIRLIENRQTGTSNAVSPVSPTSMQAFIYGAHAAFSSNASFVSIPDYAFLAKQNITEMVPWIAPTGDNIGSALVNNKLAIQNGLTFTPLAKSVIDIYDWWHSDAVSEERRSKMISGEESIMSKEQKILVTWKEYQTKKHMEIIKD
jgi:nucleoside-diphosphate-sugar epimerase